MRVLVTGSTGKLGKAVVENPEEAILKLYPKAETIYASKNWSFPDSIDRVYVTKKAKRILGFEPKFTFDYLLRKVF
ncbi:hypothetical protein [Desertivirga brevis]|uniref:hypothetical protein n=1 Tax=Desertivirga brevis TaxID=2810310 RepID=UPI001A971EA5|nr:hypothetical protein [Pedobacter sp. SYSU D00873]